MTKSLGWFTAQELAGLPGMPTTVRAIQIRAKAEWQGRKREGSKAVEYPIAILPAETQAALLEKAVSEVMQPGEDVAVEKSPIVVVENRKSSALTDKQRQVMSARLAFCREIERMMGAVSQRAAIETLIRCAQAGTLSPYLMDRVDLANDRITGERGLSERTLKRWLSTWRSAGRNEVALAPLRQRANLDTPAWLPQFLRYYQRPTKPSVAASYAEFVSAYGDAAPSIHAVQRMLKKLSPDALNRGRMSPQELKALQPFRRRATKNLFPGDVYTADGHKFDAEVINPLTGKPYRPEITTVLDVATRKVVGVSLGESESAIGVLDALRDAVRQCMFSIFYVDNGSGFANDTVREVVDRLGGTMTHSLPYNSQARGLSERGHQTIWVRAAKKLTSYIGADMDKHAGTRVHRIGRKELREKGNSRVLPTFAEFMSGVEYEIATYNGTPHRGLPKFRDPETGVVRHMSPNEAWQDAIFEGWEPIIAPGSLVDSLMRPQVIRKSRRGEIAWAGNTYFSADLTAFHDQEIRIAYDVRDASQVWAYTLDGEQIGAAKLDGNSTDYMPQTMLEMARERRQQGQFKRAVDKLETLTGHRVEVIAPTTAPSANLSTEVLEEAREYARALDQQSPKFVVPGDDVSRYRLWVRLDQRKSAGEELTADEARWYERYPSHPDFVAMKQVFQQQVG
ncbi:Mu transposase C-terminal domain-containing protein [Pseudomonas corrugata]|uniref:Mu transposase C-terminal domain-containing protein n=1 Tax=Pseudomonas corrugata TaxID=47879 RepID=UPI0022315517|nr:Mu transposase C-terminal domain-containing protein [Pseudomonas corrugata]UZD92719.1 Mu transposase C-terminal domain-containing protein [Pseudomonas corrugata]